MRTLAKNKQRFLYSLQTEEVPVYQTDDDENIIYIDIDGQKVPVETGDTELGYSTPQEFYANIAMSGGEAEAQEYGLSVADYNAVIICVKGDYPIAEGALIWHKSEVGYKDEEKTIVDGSTADYMVVKCSESISLVKYVLKAVVK